MNLIKPSLDNSYYHLNNPISLPKAFGFLWNEKMVIQINCRGYAVSQFTQPEPYKYSYAPNLEAKTFIQPEQPYYAHHPGRFLFVKDEETNEIFSAPYEPMRVESKKYLFSVGKDNIKWEVLNNDIEIEMTLTLSKEDALELWTIKVKNKSGNKRKISIYPYYTVGYMSWMNQSGKYDESLQSIVCSSITPYQKYLDYYKLKDNKDKTFLLAEKKPYAWEANQEVFEGEGGLMSPSSIKNEKLSCSDACYEMPLCALQYRLELKGSEEEIFRFVFGPAKDEKEIEEVRNKYFINKDENGNDGFQLAKIEYSEYIAKGKGSIEITTPDKELDNIVNHWLPRQMYYHGITNRLSTDPQTRNYLQDSMGMSYIIPSVSRKAFITAFSQQHESGSMPDGVILHKDAELKYINQVPHSDHCVWMPICVGVYLDETNDYEFLNELIPFTDNENKVSVFEHIDRGINWLLKDRDERGLNYIRQGDWCDPMNMVGFKGKGVSAWLTIATSYCLKLWFGICEKIGEKDLADKYHKEWEKLNDIINEYFWDGEWYSRGITDDNVSFGISSDKEGRIFINPQGWSLLCGSADEEKKKKLLKSVEEQLETPYGVEKLAPSYTSMREDVGRVSQKFPGSAENGAVYNHAAAFYIFALYTVGEKENAYRLLRKMIPSADEADIIQRGQLPVYIPNYYRGAYRQFERTAGRSSHMFNTGTTAWYYRSLIDGLFGLYGCKEGLVINPQLPNEWNEAEIKRDFRGAIFNVKIIKNENIQENEIYVNGEILEGNIITNIVTGNIYNILVNCK
ncbi:MAG: GH36-type glycosyl hydrolase domain-containing protein [Anaerocolumna sp.]